MSDDQDPKHFTGSDPDEELDDGPPTERPSYIARRMDALPGRRSHPRYRVDVEAALSTDAERYAAFCENLSLGGAFVTTHGELPPVGASVDVALHLPTVREPIHLPARVAWHREDPPPSVIPPGIGVRFQKLAGVPLEMLTAFLENRAPALAD